MSYTEQAIDIQAIKSVIERQFSSASWNSFKEPDWDGFESVFHPDANLFSADQLDAAQTTHDFVTRLQNQSKTTRRTF